MEVYIEEKPVEQPKTVETMEGMRAYRVKEVFSETPEVQRGDIIIKLPTVDSSYGWAIFNCTKGGIIPISTKIRLAAVRAFNIRRIVLVNDPEDRPE